MKTILYQPIFINPQAYFVFPQLYHADNGFQFFDVTLRKPIWWNGSSWVDANGATV